MVRTLWFLAFVGCGSASPKPTPANTGGAPTIDAQEPTACERYAELGDRVDACTALTEEQRQYVTQLRTDTGAAISENGLDGSTVDPEALCEDAISYTLREVKGSCGL